MHWRTQSHSPPPALPPTQAVRHTSPRQQCVGIVRLTGLLQFPVRATAAEVVGPHQRVRRCVGWD